MTTTMTPETGLKTYLVTGGAGFIGTHLCRRLRKEGYRVRSMDLRDPTDPVEGVEYLRGDVRDSAEIERRLEGVDAVFHLAALVSIPLCQKEPVESYSTNFGGTLAVLEAIRRKAADQPRSTPVGMLFASTAALYGSMGDDGRALAESDAARSFFSFYAAQKRASEQAMDQYLKAFGIPSLPFRFFNVYGRGQDPDSPYSGVITVFARLAKLGKPLPLNGGGSQTRDFIAVEDVAAGLVSALRLPRQRWDAQAINLGSGTRLSVKQLAEAIRGASHLSAPLVEAPARSGDVLHSLADISRARSLLGFEPRRDLEKNILELLKAI